jgi:hypothetical protein
MKMDARAMAAGSIKLKCCSSFGFRESSLAAAPILNSFRFCVLRARMVIFVSVSEMNKRGGKMATWKTFFHCVLYSFFIFLVVSGWSGILVIVDDDVVVS